MTRRAALAALALAPLWLWAGCAAAPDPAVFRDSQAPISSATDVALAELAGTWDVRARYAAPGDALAAAPERFDFAATPDGGLRVARSRLACAAGACAAQTETAVAQASGPGRFGLARAGGAPEEHWLLWADADRRVAVIGTPSGTFGWIMARGPAGPDLMRAARRILAWNGYDPARLTEVPA